MFYMYLHMHVSCYFMIYQPRKKHEFPEDMGVQIGQNYNL